MSPAPGIAILARAPVAGEAKTRLAQALGAEGAAGLAAWMLRRTVATARAAQLGPVRLFCTGDIDHPEFLACATGDHPLPRQPQARGDLGERMLRAAEAAATPDGVIVIGTDCPALTCDHLRLVARELAHQQAVVIPAEDGGYVLIAMQRPSAELFAAIHWGEPDVMTRTRQRLASMGWRWAEPETLWDVDRLEDVERLGRLLASAGETLPC
jgi:rSAM/selenodomain-associated transferase 1